jgi:hypothetical protein
MKVKARLHTRRLDEELAAGADPNADPLRHARALDLVEGETRRRIAANLRQALAEAEAPRHPFSIKAPIARAALRDAREDVEDVAERLGGPAPVRPQGVARARLLLTDGAGPLYGEETTATQLRWDLAATAEAIEHGPDVIAAGPVMFTD